jgi:hypothetical protein
MSHLPFASIIRRFNVYGSVHRKYIPIYIQQDTTLHSLFISENCSTCFGWYFHPSSGARTTVSTASGICHAVTAICCYRGRVGTGLSVLWVAYAFTSVSVLLFKIMLWCTYVVVVLGNAVTWFDRTLGSAQHCQLIGIYFMCSPTFVLFLFYHVSADGPSVLAV